MQREKEAHICAALVLNSSPLITIIDDGGWREGEVAAA